jgi:hypothetical protein
MCECYKANELPMMWRGGARSDAGIMAYVVQRMSCGRRGLLRGPLCWVWTLGGGLERRVDSGRKIDLLMLLVLDTNFLAMPAFSRCDCIVKFVIGPSLKMGLLTHSTSTIVPFKPRQHIGSKYNVCYHASRD